MSPGGPFEPRTALFAFANGGLALPDVPIEEWLGDPVVLGSGLGLLVGKTVGVFGAAWLAVRIGWAEMPESMNHLHLLGEAIVAGSASPSPCSWQTLRSRRLP